MGRQSNAIHRMPQGMSRGLGWDGSDFANSNPSDLMKRAWQFHPATMNLMAPRGLGYYDAFANHVSSVMTHMSIGPATPITARTRIPNKDLPKGIETGKTPLLLIIGPAATSYQAKVYYRSSATDSDPLDFTVVGASALPEQPTIPFGEPGDEYLDPGNELMEVLPVRCSVRVRNFTAEINRGGQVHVLRMTTGFALGIGKKSAPLSTNAELDDFMEGIRDHARTRTYDGADFGGAGMQKNCTVADQSRSLMFQNFNQATVSTDVPWAPDTVVTSVPAPPEPYPVYPIDKYHYDPTYTPIAILFEAFSNVQPGQGGPIGNTYGVTIQSQFLAHYKQGTMLANLAYEPKHDVNGTTVNKFREKEESHGSAFHKILDVAGSAANIGAKIAPLLF
jgi:hypothetical protein